MEDDSLTCEIRTLSQNPKAKLTFMYKWAYEKGPPPAMAEVTGFNPPYPSPAPVMGPPPPGYGYPPPPPGHGYPPPQPGFGVQVQQQPELPKKNKWGWFGRFLGRLCAAVVIDDAMNNDT
ncbi:hypothetical protein LOK49_LG10G01224 [Camellia lanceoleosa]|uniref:Uncharacterized protein n=1 Tax=Camellia lanceoleosa TaxID=1840588 RepID=A0ACC0GD77_9ERIC|nr:hypothetical protein LOK49_LG10G01224 [Camellia lanceoleosa]